MAFLLTEFTILVLGSVDNAIPQYLKDAIFDVQLDLARGPGQMGLWHRGSFVTVQIADGRVTATAIYVKTTSRVAQSFRFRTNEIIVSGRHWLLLLMLLLLLLLVMMVMLLLLLLILVTNAAFGTRQDRQMLVRHR